MKVGRATVVVDPFFVVVAVVVMSAGLLSTGPLGALAPVALTLLLARAVGAAAAALVVLLGNDGWATVTLGLFQTPTRAATTPWARRLEPLAGLVGAFVGVAAVYLLSVALEAAAPSWSASLYSGAWVGFWFLVLASAPLVPFDGGQVLREWLPGPAGRRARVAAAVSVVTGLLLVAYLVGQGDLVAACGLGALTVVNGLRAAGRTSVLPGGHVCTHSCDVLSSLYLAGRDVALATHLRRARETDPVLAVLLERWDSVADPATAAAVLAAYRGRETVPTSRGAYLLWCVRADRREETTALVVDPTPVATLALMVAVTEASERGADEQVVLLAERVLHSTACNACVPTSATTLHSSRSRIRLGDVDRAVADLSRCRVWTVADLASLYVHPDLAAVREHPAWPSVRAALPSRG